MRSSGGSHRPWQAAAAGIGWLLLVVAALALSRIDGVPSTALLLLPAIVLAAYLGGAWPAAIVAPLATIAAFVASVSPIGSASLSEPAAWIASAMFALVAAGTTAAMGLMHRSIRLLRARHEEAEAALALRHTLFQELRHRIANTVQFIASLLRLQRRQIGDSPESARAALDATIGRLEVMSRIHRNLYDPAGLDRGFEEVMRTICEDLLKATDTNDVRCTVESPPLDLPAEKKICLMLIVTETMINSLKHAYAAGAPGSIEVRIARLSDGRMELRVRDDGSGLPGGFDPDAGGGLGLRLIRGLTQQLGGEFSMVTGSGTITRVVFRV